MASTSTSKQPMLVDRPFHGFVPLGSVAALSTAGNLSTLSPGGLSVLLSGSDNPDGACIDSISIVANEANLTAARVLILLSTVNNALQVTTANTAVVAQGVISSSTVGQRTQIELPPVLTPVPRLAGDSATTAAKQKNTALLVPADHSLFCGLSTAILLPTPASTVTVFAQGGLF